MDHIICALCGKNQQTKILYKANFDLKDISSRIFSARRSPDNIHYQLLKCEDCGLIFSSPIFKPKIIDNYYRKSVCGYEHEIPNLTETYLKLFKRVPVVFSKNLKVLEIGCGNGFFLRALYNLGINNVFGVEPSEKMVNQAPKEIKKNIKLNTFKKNLFKKDFFDVVCCFHTLDHVVNPNELISSVFSVLKEQGHALFVVHDSQGLSVKIFKERSPIFDIQHIYLFNKSNLSKIFISHGFFVSEIFNVQNEYSINYWLRMSAIPNKFKTVIQQLINKLSISNACVKISAGNIGIIAKKNC